MSTIATGNTTTNTIVVTGDTTGNLYIQTGQLTPALAMTVTNNQLVGIGTSTPGYALDVKASSGGDTIRYSGNGGISSYLYTDSNYFGLADATNLGGNAIYGNHTLNFVSIQTNGSEKLRVDINGNLGLGVTPSAWSGFTALQNKSASMAVTSNGNNVDYSVNRYNNGTNDIFYQTGNYALIYEQASGAGAHRWYTSTATGTAGGTAAFNQAMTLDAGGNLLIGTTSSVINVGCLQVVNAGYGWLVRNSGASAGRYWTFQMTTNGNCYIINDSSTGVTLSYGGNSWGTYSDERLKTDLKPIQNAVSKVDTLRAVTGRFKTDDENVSRSFLIAQDVQAVLPEAVSSDIRVNSDDKTEYLTLSYTDTIPLLVKAIQELNAKITELQAKVGI